MYVKLPLSAGKLFLENFERFSDTMQTVSYFVQSLHASHVAFKGVRV